MEGILLQLLNNLEAIAHDYDGIYDTVSREAMREAVFHGFLRSVPDYTIPSDFGLLERQGTQVVLSERGNLRVREALVGYIQAANTKANELGLTFQGRLAAFQNSEVVTEDGSTYDDFFGEADPSWFSESGEWVQRK